MRKISVLLVVLFFVSCRTIFAAEGDVVWTRTYNGTASGNDQGRDIAVDGSGNVYVTGFEWVNLEDWNIWVRKYDSSGNEVWTRTHNGTANGNDEGCGIVVDRSGNVYVIGSEKVLMELQNIWVRKYDTDGDEVWTKTYNSVANQFDIGRGIAIDDSGNVYVTGSETVGGASQNIWVRKYDTDGDVVWTKTYNGTANGQDVGEGIAVDGGGNVYVTGYETVSGESYNIWVRKYDSEGDVLWTRTHNGTANDWDLGLDIAVDGSGNVYVIGYEMVSGESYNIWVRKYDSAGNEVWTRTHNGLANNADEGRGIAVDGSGNVYVTGDEFVTGEDPNVWTRKYDQDGSEVWTRTYNGVINGPDAGFGLAIDGSGSVYVTGCEWVSGEQNNIWVRKYEGVFGEHFEPPVEGGVKIQGGEKGYVNPGEGEKAKIHFQPSGAGRVNVKIYTLRGLLVWEGSKSVSGVQDFIEWNCRNKENKVVASGIYAVYVEGPGINVTKKVAILK
ncbi:MAG: SBBP repeat-containing protein [Elusimicrobiota bacterium]|nr:SBBP repeat-containing protein [Elusimicrobiota bacterium]